MTLAWAELAAFAAAAVSALWAAYTYLQSHKLEKARWALQLFEKFYEGTQYKTVREALDCEDEDNEGIRKLVEAEGPEFTDYLNFFEFVAFLRESGQLTESDIRVLFQYYLDCLRKRKRVYAYIQNPSKGYEGLRKLIA